MTAEQARVDREFQHTAKDLHQKKMNSTYNEVMDSGLDYTMVNLTTIDKIDEELMYKPILNVSVVGRLDNLKVGILIIFAVSEIKYNLEYTDHNRERLRNYTLDLKKRMGAFRDILIDGSAKRQFFKQVDDI